MIFGIPSGIYSDILSDRHSCILYMASAICSDILFGSLARILTFFLTFFLALVSGILFGMCSGPGVAHRIRSWRYGVQVHSIWSWRYGVWVQAWLLQHSELRVQAASRAGRGDQDNKEAEAEVKEEEKKEKKEKDKQNELHFSAKTQRMSARWGTTKFVAICFLIVFFEGVL